MAKRFSGIQVGITGATGFIGALLSRRLLDEGAHVRALVRNQRKAAGLEAAGAETVSLDLTQAEALPTGFEGCHTVFHCAAVLNEYRPRSYYQLVNVEGTRKIAAAALQAGVKRFVYASTVWVYGLHGASLNEQAPYAPSGQYYIDTKIEAERLVRDLAERQGLPAVIVQPSELYGPEDRTWTLRPLQMFHRGKMILIGGGGGDLQPLYIDDAVEGFLLAALKGRPGERYILCGKEHLTVKDHMAYLQHMGNFKPAQSLPAWLGFAAAWILECAARMAGRPPLFSRQEVKALLVSATYSGRKAHDELGFEPAVNLEKGMQHVKQWIDTHPELLNP